MKKIIPVIMFLMLANSAFSQSTNSAATLTKQDYLPKSRHQKNTAWILLGGGTIAWLAGASAYMNENNDRGGTKGKPAMEVGGIAALASVPFFIAGSKNKKKAAALSFNMENIPSVSTQNMVYHSYPALSLSIVLR